MDKTKRLEASSKRSEQANEETWVVCFEYFTENTVALRWGHIFHEECFVQFTRARRHPCCPNCRMSYSKSYSPIRLVMNPQEFGSYKKNILVSTKKRLKKENQKLKQQNKEMEMKLIEEEKSHFETIKMIEK